MTAQLFGALGTNISRGAVVTWVRICYEEVLNQMVKSYKSNLVPLVNSFQLCQALCELESNLSFCFLWPVTAVQVK